MTATQLLWAFLGFILCAVIFTTVCLLIMGAIWCLIRNDLDFDDITYMDALEDEEQ